MSIKSKIIFMTFALLFVLGLVVTGAALTAFYHDRELLIAGNDASITAFKDQINTEITALEKNALDLALMGEIYYEQGKVKQVGDFFTKQILQNYPHSMGRVFQKNSMLTRKFMFQKNRFLNQKKNLKNILPSSGSVM